MIKIEVESAETVTKSGVAAKTGKPYNIREQKAYAYTVAPDGKPNRYPTSIKISLRDEQPPYQPGLYTLSPASLYTNKFDQLEISAILAPLPAAAAVKAA